MLISLVVLRKIAYLIVVYIALNYNALFLNWLQQKIGFWQHHFGFMRTNNENYDMKRTLLPTESFMNYFCDNIIQCNILLNNKTPLCVERF